LIWIRILLTKNVSKLGYNFFIDDDEQKREFEKRMDEKKIKLKEYNHTLKNITAEREAEQRREKEKRIEAARQIRYADFYTDPKLLTLYDKLNEHIEKLKAIISDYQTRINSIQDSIIKLNDKKQIEILDHQKEHLEKDILTFKNEITKLEVIKREDFNILNPQTIPYISLIDEKNKAEHTRQIISNIFKDKSISTTGSQTLDSPDSHLFQYISDLEHEIKQRLVLCQACTYANPAGSKNCQICETPLLPPKEGGAVNYKTKYLKYKSKNSNF